MRNDTPSPGICIPSAKALPPLPLGDPENETEEDLVSDGTGAIRVYQQLLISADLTEGVKLNHKKLLLQYCKLDTAAMVMIWRHWVGESQVNISI